MDLAQVILHLRKNVPVFAGRVAGAADFQRGLEGEAQMDFPAAYVIPLEEDAEGNASLDGLYQHVTERIGVVVAFANTQDRRGQGVTALYEPTRLTLFRALLNWRPQPLPGTPQRAERGLEYGGGRPLDFDRARLWYQYDFTLPTLITDDDGWHVAGDPLTAVTVDVDISEPPDGVPEAVVRVELPPADPAIPPRPATPP